MLFSVNVQQRHLADSPKNLSLTCSVLLLLGAIAASVAPPLRGQSGSPTIELISVGTDGNNSTLRGPSGSGLAGGSGTVPAPNHGSANCRYVVFQSDPCLLRLSDTDRR